MERRSSGIERARARVEKRDDDSQTITGYGIIYYDGTPETEYVLWDDQWGRAVERIMPGAADKPLSRPDDVRGLFNHDPNHVLGRNKAGTMKLSSDSTGVRYDIEPGNTAIARDVMAHIERGDVSGSSFAFRVDMSGQKWVITGENDGRTDEVREIHELSELYDMGPVTFPAYESTTAGLRAAGGADEARAARDAWRKKGVPVEVVPTKMRAVEVENLEKRLDALPISG